MNKAEVKGLLQERVQEIVVFSKKQTPESFYAKAAEGVWSAAENVEHLTQSVLPLVRLLGAPKSYFLDKWGKADHASRPYEQMVSIYDTALGRGGVATGTFVPQETSPEIEQLLEGFVNAHETFVLLIESQWTEEDLELYPIPHPLLGLITTREMLFFTAYHLRHHLEIMQRRVKEVA